MPGFWLISTTTATTANTTPTASMGMAWKGASSRAQNPTTGSGSSATRARIAPCSVGGAWSGPRVRSSSTVESMRWYSSRTDGSAAIARSTSAASLSGSSPSM